MRTIHKHQLKFDQETVELELPEDAKILHVDIQEGGLMQEGELSVWVEIALVSTGNTVKRTFGLFSTGVAIDEGWGHIATILDKPFVWHIYELNGSDKLMS